MSPRFKQLFGYEDHEIPNTSNWWMENIHSEDREIAIDNFKRHCADPSHPYDQVVRYRHKDGSTVWVRCRGIAIRDEDGNAKRMLGAHTDVTALKRAEESLEQSNLDLQQFASVVSHDLQEPLRAIAGFAQLLQKDYVGKLDSVADDYIDRIISGVNRMRTMIDDVLAFSLVDSQGKSLRPVDLNLVVKEVVLMLERSIAESGAQVTFDELPRSVMGDSSQLAEVLLNLISNAIKYRPGRATTSGDLGA